MNIELLDILRCPFHGFSWNMDGSLKHLPCSWDFPQVNGEWPLRPVQVDTWGGFVFVNMDLDAEPLLEFLDPLPTLLALPLVEVAHEASPVPALWALCDVAEVALKLVVMAGVAALVFAACYLVVDVLEWRHWTPPFLWLGVNPLAIYFLSEFARHLLDAGVFAVETGHFGTKDYIFWRYLNPHLESVSAPRASLLFALAFTGVWIGVARLLYQKGIRIRI